MAAVSNDDFLAQRYDAALAQIAEGLRELAEMVERAGRRRTTYLDAATAVIERIANNSPALSLLVLAARDADIHSTDSKG